jgi:hypothetical protein
MRRGRALVGASVVCAALVLAGCDSTDDPTSAPTPTATNPTTSTTSASPTTSAGPSPSQTSSIPAAARKHTPAGAEAFVKFFVNQSALAWTKPDSSLIRSISMDSCKSCASLARTAEELEADGQRYEHPPIRLESAEALSGKSDRVTVAANIRQIRVNVITDKGDVIRTDEAAQLQRTFLVVWGEGEWRVGGIA